MKYLLLFLFSVSQITLAEGLSNKNSCEAICIAFSDYSFQQPRMFVGVDTYHKLVPRMYLVRVIESSYLDLHNRCLGDLVKEYEKIVYIPEQVTLRLQTPKGDYVKNAIFLEPNDCE